MVIYTLPKKKIASVTASFLIVFFFILAAGGSAALTVTAKAVGLGRQTVIYGRSSDSITLDPAFAQDEESFKVICNIFEGLVRFKLGTTEIEPCLAESWRISPDGREWVFNLRKDVRFHDGTPFDAQAVRFSFERQLFPEGQRAVAYANFIFGVIEEIITPDPYTVKFILKYPYSPFIYYLAMPAAAPIVSPTAAASWGENFGTKPAGTGPFVFARWKKGKYIILKANRDYWGKTPEINTVIFKVIGNSRIRSLALITGLCDIVDGLCPADTALLEQKGFLVHKKPGLDVSYLGFYTHKEPFNSAVLRKAVAMAIDREHIAGVLLGGAAFPANGPLPPGVLGYDPNLQLPSYDPEGAKELLAAAGHAAGMKITIATYCEPRPYNPSGEKLAVAIAEDLAKAGIYAEIKKYNWENYKEVLLNGEGDAFIYGWISDNGDPDNFLFTLFSPYQRDNSCNISRYTSHELTYLLTQGRRERDSLVREQIYRQACKVITNELPLLFLNHSMRLAATSPEVDGFVLHPGVCTVLSTIKFASHKQKPKNSANNL